jgi:pseudouridine-5'-phosphate glycosidase
MPDSTTADYLDIAPEVQDALASRQPVVALESTIICHGMPWPRNAETAMLVEAAVRDSGAVPATIAILGGRLKAGLDEGEIRDLGERGPQIAKTSRRDIPFMVARGEDGATTVAATMIIAAMAGIRVMATGGIGGVHRGVEETMDISADLEELARTNIAVICAGIKSVLDIGRTLEYLETVGVPVLGFGTDTVPAFYARSSGLPVDYRVDEPAEAARIINAKFGLGLDGGMVIGNPVPEAAALIDEEINGVIETAIAEMNEKGITGKETTPFLLGQIAERTDGRSLEANIALVLDNARVAAEIAAACYRLARPEM